MNTYHFYTEEKELYHLTKNELETLLNGYFLARALQLYYDTDILTFLDKAKIQYKNNYAKEIGIVKFNTYTWEDMILKESSNFIHD